MATATLVDNRDIEIGRRIISALTKAGIGVNVAFWAHIPQISEWQLFIATPLVDSKGERSAYDAVLRTLRNDGIDADLPWRRIFLRSPRDPVLKSLEKQSKNYPGEAFRILNAPVGDRFVEDAYVYRGAIDIQEFENRPRGIAQSTYYVTYAPYSGPGEATWAVTGLEDLRVLLSRLHVNRDAAESAIKELSGRKRTLIPNMQLRARDLKRLKPA
jgi:hypothetical protein